MAGKSLPRLTTSINKMNSNKFFRAVALVISLSSLAVIAQTQNPSFSKYSPTIASHFNELLEASLNLRQSVDVESQYALVIASTPPELLKSSMGTELTSTLDNAVLQERKSLEKLKQIAFFVQQLEGKVNTPKEAQEWAKVTIEMQPKDILPMLTNPQYPGAMQYANVSGKTIAYFYQNASYQEQLTKLN